MTGCAQPAVVNILCRPKELTGKEVHLVLRSFHLDGASEARIASIIEDFQRLGVRRVSPCHCTGDRARPVLADAFGESFFRTAVGWTMTTGAMQGGLE